MPSGVTRFTAMALAACGALAAVELAQAFGVEVPRAWIVALASAAAVLAATAAVRNVAHVWRGPLIVEFHRGEGQLFDAREAAAVREAAIIRGTMGGAGYLFPRRLALSAAAWAAASVQALLLVQPEHGGASHLPAVVAGLAVAAVARFPAIPFYYREAAAGCVVVFPAAAGARLLSRARLAPAPSPVELSALEAGADPALDDAVPSSRPPARRDEPPA